MKETLKKMAFGNFLSLAVWNMGVMALKDKSKANLIRFVLFKNGRELVSALYEAKKKFAEFLVSLEHLRIYFDGGYPVSEEIWNIVHGGIGFFSLPHDPSVSVKELIQTEHNYMLEKMEAAFETDEERRAFEDFTEFLKDRIFVEVLLREN